MARSWSRPLWSRLPFPCYLRPSPQVGFMSREVGASLAFLLDTTRNSSGAAAKKQTGADRLMVSIGIAHLRRCGDS